MANSSSKNDYFCLSLWPLDMPRGHLITWAALTALLVPFTIAANALLIYGLYKAKQLTTITNKFLLLMIISDLCSGIVVFPMVVALVATSQSFRSCAFELVTQYIAFFFAYFSFFMLMCVSMDRYIHVTKLNQYNKYMNEFRMKVIMLLSFVMSATISYIAFAFPSFPLQILLSSSDLFGVLLMCFLYAKVFKRISLHAENFKKMLGDVGTTKANREVKRELSATKTIRVLLLTLLVLYFPYNIVSGLWTYYKYQKGTNPPLQLDVLEYLAYVIVFSNAAINAIIFIMGNTAVKRLLLNKFRAPSSQISPSEVCTTQNNNAVLSIGDKV